MVVETAWGFCAVSTHGAGLWSACLPQTSPQVALQAAQIADAAGDLRGLSCCPPVDDPPQSQVLRDAAELLRAYFQGAFSLQGACALQDMPLDLDDYTPFSRDVSLACARIAPGELVTYGELAAAVGSPGASRAAGQVMARNRLPLFVPCHRVIGAGGRLTGFGGGLALKARLLEFEGRKVKSDNTGNWRIVG